MGTLLQLAGPLRHRWHLLGAASAYVGDLLTHVAAGCTQKHEDGTHSRCLITCCQQIIEAAEMWCYRRVLHRHVCRDPSTRLMDG